VVVTEFNIKSENSSYDFYRNGIDFMKAALMCSGMKDDDVLHIIDENKICILPAPTVVSAAFACEMFFKALLIHNNISFSKGNKGHNLLELYNALPENFQKIICKFCITYDDISHFQKILNDHSKDFVNIRYYIENNGWNGMSPIYMVSLCFNLSQIIKYLLDNSGDEI